ncbi:MAG: hypothetical protein HRT47_12860 [Candidatus Caenarcaniphilales bacterium]|nr:hypothetical protein [Candidatus Caenarcaniphilales bacterium]
MGIFRSAAFRFGAIPGSGPNPRQWRNEDGTGFHDQMEARVNGMYHNLGLVLNGGNSGPVYSNNQPTLSPNPYARGSNSLIGNAYESPRGNYSSFPYQGVRAINVLNTTRRTPWNHRGGSNLNVGLHNNWLLNARNGLSRGIFGQGQYSIPSYQAMGWGRSPISNFHFGGNGAFNFLNT